jgi:hypothetical protein
LQTNITPQPQVESTTFNAPFKHSSLSRIGLMHKCTAKKLRKQMLIHARVAQNPFDAGRGAVICCEVIKEFATKCPHSPCHICAWWLLIALCTYVAPACSAYTCQRRNIAVRKIRMATKLLPHRILLFRQLYWLLCSVSTALLIATTSIAQS